MFKMNNLADILKEAITPEMKRAIVLGQTNEEFDAIQSKQNHLYLIQSCLEETRKISSDMKASEESRVTPIFNGDLP